MNRRNLIGVAALAAVILGGCVPGKRVVWSPDGRRAAVLGTDGLHLCDAAGTLSPLRVPGARHAEWLPDSRTLVLAVQTPAKRWDEAAAAMQPAERARIEQTAGRLRDEVMSHSGAFDQFDPPSLKALPTREAVATVLYLRDRRPEGIREKVGAKWDELSQATVDLWTVERYDADAAAGAGRTRLAGGFELELQGLRVSPDGKNVALVSERGPSDQSSLSLWVTSAAQPGRPRHVADHVSMYPDWSPDGHWVNYISANAAAAPGDKSLRLGTLTRREVCDAGGSLRREFGPASELAGLLFDQYLKVRALSDGQLLFASIELHLPSTAHDMPQHGSLYSVDPARRATVARVLPRDVEPLAGDALSLFEVSPDGARVAIPDTGGGMFVLELASGSWINVQKSKENNALASLPCWRNSNELCYVAPAGSEQAAGGQAAGERAAVMLWTSAGQKNLSATWPDSAVRGFLLPEEKDANTSAADAGTAGAAKSGPAGAASEPKGK